MVGYAHETRIPHNGMCVAFVDMQLRRNFYWPIYFLLNLFYLLYVFFKRNSRRLVLSFVNQFIMQLLRLN